MLRSVFGKFQIVLRQTVISPRKTCRRSAKLLRTPVMAIGTGVALYYSLKKLKQFPFELNRFGYENELSLKPLFHDSLYKLAEPLLSDRIKECEKLDKIEYPPIFQWQYASQMVKVVADLVHQTSPAVVRIYLNEGRCASGFFVDKAGLILTNSHVVKAKKRVTVITADDKLYHGIVLSCDTELDLAVIQIEGATKEFPAIKLGDSDKITMNDSVITIGSPEGIKTPVMGGVVTLIHHKEFEIQTHIPSYGGASGSPIINKNGEAIGVLGGARTNHISNKWIGNSIRWTSTYAIPSNEAQKFLTEVENQKRAESPSWWQKLILGYAFICLLL